ncbi:zinc-dependent metalloprotease family protein [Enhygromyxa salina]|uniref:Uncharacterized protein n=1 Tax=Enhygromyxa salina TaxID=215803 RepID=A0A2S9YY93_9BACT|nr:zinc-dependent metalloprotease family protein [Enhygromyxa salina]PRQ10060.1 hypothetical protein ENSA7_02660 [Enhygromyxa salina]
MRDTYPPNNASLGLTTFALAIYTALSVGCATETSEDVGDETATSDTGDGDGDTGENMAGAPARGIHITEVEANQGTAILIGKDGEWVGPGDRNAFMIRDRDTLVRLQHTVDENWIPREIIGVLHIRDEVSGEELATRTRPLVVEGPSDPKKLDSEFFFSILADEAQPGLSYWVELLEAGGAVDPGVEALSEGVNVTPDDFELVGYEQTPLEMKVMVVPIHYTWVDPPTLVEPTEADLQLVHDDLLQTNPLQTVTLTLHEPYEYTNHLTNLGSLLGPMSALRNNETEDPNVYYHALVDVRGPAVNMVAGIAQLTGDSKDGASSRVAATVWFKQNPDLPPAGSSGTIVHEIGHNQGLQHVFCPGAATTAAGPDPNYPHDGGTIGVFGFGIRSFRLYTPTAAHDYMTYCGNAWVSDWTWNKTYKRIQTLTSWDYAGAPAGGAAGAAAPSSGMAPKVPLLVGTLFADGSEDWLVMMGPAPSEEQLGSEQRIALTRDGEVVVDLYSAVSRLSDHETVMLTAPLTIPAAELAEIEGIVRVDWRGDNHPVALESLHVDRGVKLDR